MYICDDLTINEVDITLDIENSLLLSQVKSGEYYEIVHFWVIFQYGECVVVEHSDYNFY